MKNEEKLYKQQLHWESMLTENPELFGESPSEPARRALEIFKNDCKANILELGGGQGRDTIFFGENGLNVTVLDYTESGVTAINQKASRLGLSKNIIAKQNDVREGLPFENDTFDACYSHMLFCMALTSKELEYICSEIHRVLKKGGLNFYTTRNTNDLHFGKGIHRGEDMYEMNGFIVHFFDKKKIEKLSKGFEIISINEFEEGELPRKLYEVLLRK